MKTTIQTIAIAVPVLLSLLSADVTARSARRGGNLMYNGGFDHEDDPLSGWTYNYGFLYQREATEFDSRHFEENHERVEVLAQEGGRHNVLRLQANPPAGTKVDGPPIPIDSDGRYRLTMYAKTTGPDVRLIIECYRWRPGIRPHDGIPKLTELRRTFRSKPVYFGSQRDGNMSKVTRQWSKGVREFPDKTMSRQAQLAWQRSEFAVLHVVAVLGAPTGSLYIDDVVLERIE